MQGFMLSTEVNISIRRRVPKLYLVWFYYFEGIYFFGGGGVGGGVAVRGLGASRVLVVDLDVHQVRHTIRRKEGAESVIRERVRRRRIG